MPHADPADVTRNQRIVAKALEEGRVIPLLGAGVNLCDLPTDDAWATGASRLPSAPELARHLADECGVADLLLPHEREDLVRVSQTIATLNGRAWLYDKLHAVFAGDFQPTTLHRFLARLPATLRARGATRPYPLILTTNYDDTLERAFSDAEEPYDVLWYSADGVRDRGRFWHWPWPQESSLPRPIDRPNEYDAVSLEDRTVILKFHGRVDRIDSDRDSYVITEDHYIEYITRTQVANLIPPELIAKLGRSHFLFLAYALRDWNVRVLLHRMWAGQGLDYPSWAVQRETHRVDERWWARRNVEILTVELGDYIRGLARTLSVEV